MADIGTDHGFLPVYLWEAGISPHVIMADISRGSLDKARDNCEMLHPGQDFDLRLGSGIEVLADGEVDAVAIAGMGGILMTLMTSGVNGVLTGALSPDTRAMLSDMGIPAFGGAGGSQSLQLLRRILRRHEGQPRGLQAQCSAGA